MKIFLFIGTILLSGGWLSAQTTFKLSSGATLKLDTAKVVINGSHVELEGTLDAGRSEIILTGDHHISFRSNSNALYRLSLNKQAGTELLLADSMHIIDSVLFQAGGNYIRLGDHHVFMDVRAGINGHGASNFFITDGAGALRHKQLAAAFHFFYPVGYDKTSYNPIFVFTSDLYSDVYGVRCLEHLFEQGDSGLPRAAEAIDVSWDISAHHPDNHAFDLYLHWNGADELTGFDRTNSTVAYYGPMGWEPGNGPNCLPATGQDPYTQNGNFQNLTRTGIYSVVNCSSPPLPLELLDFQVEKTDQEHALLRWTTAHEINTSHFEIERSTDGTQWTLTGTLAAAGFSRGTEDYEFTDDQLSAAFQTYYYRLRMVDQDGSFEYSPVRSIKLSAGAPDFLVYPNPTGGALFVQAGAGNSSRHQLILSIFSARGREVLRQTLPADGIPIQFPASLPSGMYQVVVHREDGSEQISRRVVLVRE